MGREGSTELSCTPLARFPRESISSDHNAFVRTENQHRPIAVTKLQLCVSLAFPTDVRGSLPRSHPGRHTAVSRHAASAPAV